MKTYTTPAIVLSSDVTTETKSVSAIMIKSFGLESGVNNKQA